MSVSVVNSTINTNPQVQQQKSKSKAKAPLYGVGAGVIAGAGIAAVANYCGEKSNIESTLKDIKGLEQCLRNHRLDLSLATTDAEKRCQEVYIKEFKQHIESANARLLKYKKAVKPMGILKSVAKAPITYILAATGLVVGLCVNHKNKSAKQ